MTLSESDLTSLVFAINKISTYDLSNYSSKSLMRRFERLLNNRHETPAILLNKLNSNPLLVDEIIEEITVNTTELFRDPHVWQFLRMHVLPKLAKRNKINIWIAGVSKGQEAFSLMMLLNEMNLLEKSHIIATDINAKVIAEAKTGLYKYRCNLDYLSNYDKVMKENPFNFEEKFNTPYEKYFSINKSTDQIVMHEFLRKKPIYLKHDLVTGGNLNFTKFDLVLCRNVMIYFDQNLQNKVLNTFYNNMFPESFLLLGIHESIIGAAITKFTKKGLIYQNK